MTMELIKIEDGLCDGEVLYHTFIKKTDQEVNELRQRNQQKKLLKQQRINQQNENIQKKQENKQKNNINKTSLSEQEENEQIDQLSSDDNLDE